MILVLGLMVHACSGDGSQIVFHSEVESEMVEFAIEQIERNVSDLPAQKIFSEFAFTLDTAGLEEQEYAVELSGRNVTVSAGGERGLMYGGLEVAEQVRLYGKVETSAGSPFIENRGIKFNIPLDARTPSYDDSGDAAQENIKEMWNWEFWKEFLDQMAIHRYNVLSLWNPHPFPSMIKMEDYPDVALKNVCRTTLEPEGMENEWGDPGLVTSNVMEHLEVVLKITIEEKIAFWQRVMRHARNRGIDVYWINWNICPNSVAPPVDPYYKTYEINLGEFREGKHGITYEISNPVTIDYYRKAVRQFLVTYPDVTGIGVTAGEHMPLSWNGYNREQWLWETYGLGIRDAIEFQPGRSVRFIHRVWHSDMDQIMKYWSHYPGPFEVSFKYAKARLYSSPELPFAESHIEEMKPYGLKSWWNLRNDDIFVYRWGDPEYVRLFLANLPSDHSAGYYMGSDGYVWGREFISKDPSLSGELEIQKHWYRFMLWGRLGYNNGLSESFFIRHLEANYGLDDGRLLYETWKAVSRIIPLVNQYHWRDWDHHWSVEGCMARPMLGGYRDLFDFMDNRTLENSMLQNPADFTRVLTRGGSSKKISPLIVADSLDMFAAMAMEGTAILQGMSNQPELGTVIDDIRAQAHLGRYYAEKIRAAVHLSLYRLTGKESEKEMALRKLETSSKIWNEYAAISTGNYRSQMLARTNRLDWHILADSIDREIETVRQYKPN